MSNGVTLKDFYQPPSAGKVTKDGNTATQQYFKEKQDMYQGGKVPFEAIRTKIYEKCVSSVHSCEGIAKAAFYKKDGLQKIPGHTYGLAEIEALIRVCLQQIDNLQDEIHRQNNITSAKETIKSHWDKVSSLYFPFMIRKNDQSANIRMFPIYIRLNDFYVCLSLFGSDDNWFTQGLPIPDNLYLDNPPVGNTDQDAEEETAPVDGGQGINQQADISTLLRQMKQLCV